MINKPWSISKTGIMDKEEYPKLEGGTYMVEELTLRGAMNGLRNNHTLGIRNIFAYRACREGSGIMYTKSQVSAKAFENLTFAHNVCEAWYNSELDLMRMTYLSTKVVYAPDVSPGQHLENISLVDIVKQYMKEPTADFYYYGSEGPVEMLPSGFVAAIMWVGGTLYKETSAEAMLHNGLLVLMRNGLEPTEEGIQKMKSLDHKYLTQLADQISKVGG